jgi:lipid A ethanolaminephosphotransferase
MFQDVGRDGYRAAMAKSRENLLDVLQRAGIEVLWRDNNSGCKHVCDRVPQEDLAHLQLPGLCHDGHCDDEVLVHQLQERIDRLSGDGVIVLHMLGSHGPAYSKRYPPEHAAFKPACESSQLEKCSRDEIINAYDNTIRYTDHVLGAVIALLERNTATLDSAFLYVSDHGESLGEHGLYLHGLPYAIAPEEQTHVPMVVWLSEGYRQDIDMHCMRGLADQPFSHDNLFHSVLGLMQVSTTVYKQERDLFSSCRRVSG